MRMEALYLALVFTLIFTRESSGQGTMIFSSTISACQGGKFRQSRCQVSSEGEQSLIDLRSVTVITSSDSDKIVNASQQSDKGCFRAKECLRTIHNYTDTGINSDYRYLYQYIASQCQGRPECSGDLPQWWDLVDDTRPECGDGIQYFSAVLIHIECWLNESLFKVEPPPSTTERTKPTTPTTTTPFPAAFAIYMPELMNIEKVILGVAIGLAIIILLVLLIVLYCCERYRNSKKLGKLLSKLGAPQQQNDVFDELDYGRSEGWHEEAESADALGEYTGVKPDEFVTLDKDAHERNGQIVYEIPTKAQKGNSCSTIDRLNDNRSRPAVNVCPPQVPVDYQSYENVELEKRMAETLNQVDGDEQGYSLI